MIEFKNSSGTPVFYARGGALFSNTVATPSEALQLVPRGYVDAEIAAAVQGLNIKASVKIATSSTFATGSLAGTNLEITSNTASGGSFIEIDGIQLSIKERILYYGT
jgi:hypothetical protein